MGFKGRGEILGSFLCDGLRYCVLVGELGGGGFMVFSCFGQKIFNRSFITLKFGAEKLERESQERESESESEREQVVVFTFASCCCSTLVS